VNICVVKKLLLRLLLILVTFFSFQVQAQNPSYQGIWWKSDESGWGINLNHQEDLIFAVWFTYDKDGQAIWWAATMAEQASGTFTGDLLQMSGPTFSNQPWNSEEVSNEIIGKATIIFSDTSNANFHYTVDGVTQSKAITYYEFGDRPFCQLTNSPADANLATNFSGIWWATGGDEAGWGVNFVDQDNPVFVTWFTYDDENQPT
jgi:hypothetical protein